MLDLAISIDTEGRGTTIIETNHGESLRALDWPQGCDFQLVAYDPRKRVCEVVFADELADDIASALSELDAIRGSKLRQTDWYQRLRMCAKGARAALG